MTHQVSSKGVDMIKRFEGLRLRAYKDAVGVWTVGYGHTGPDVHPGMAITGEEAVGLLMQDLRRFERCVDHYLEIEPTQAEFDALVSFAYNLGCKALHDSTLMRKFNAGDKRGAAEEFLRWNHAGGHELAGLTHRRMLEKERFLT